MKRKIALLASLLGLTATLSFGAPILGGSLFVANTGNVTAKFLGHSAAYTNDLYLDLGIALATDPADIFIFRNHMTPIGSTFSLGNFTAGQELVFYVKVINTGDVWYTGPGSRNADGLAHVVVDDNRTGVIGTYVGFEDVFGGGDRDYNDLEFSFTNTQSTPSVPEPSTLGLLGLGLMGLFTAMRRRRS